MEATQESRHDSDYQHGLGGADPRVSRKTIQRMINANAIPCRRNSKDVNHMMR